ncbi:MAG TPA: polysaccharide deacetylase family protein [Pelobium sp.]
MLFLTKTPAILKRFYPKQLIWNKSRAEKVIYLTFDDGPIPIVTPWVIKTLKKYNAKATFFCIGDNIQKNPEIFEQLKAEGHCIGNHTFNHLKGWKSDDEKYIANILKCQQLTQTNLFRPPYGRIKKSQIKRIFSLAKSEWSMVNSEFAGENQDDLRIQEQRAKSKDDLQSSPISHLTSHISNLQSHISIIMWDVLSGDFDPNLSPEKCLRNVLKHTENGSIVVFHDSLKAWDRLAFVLPKALETWTNSGFKFGVL